MFKVSSTQPCLDNFIRDFFRVSFKFHIILHPISIAYSCSSSLSDFVIPVFSSLFFLCSSHNSASVFFFYYWIFTYFPFIHFHCSLVSFGFYRPCQVCISLKEFYASICIFAPLTSYVQMCPGPEYLISDNVDMFKLWLNCSPFKLFPNSLLIGTFDEGMCNSKLPECLLIPHFVIHWLHWIVYSAINISSFF